MQSALGGQQYYTNDLNNFLNERNNYFSNNVQPALQASEFNQQQNLSALGMLNSQQLGAASGLAGDAAGMANIGNGYNNTGNSYMGWANQQQQMGLQASAASAANKSNFITGLGGLAGGLVNSAMPSNGLSGLFGSGPGSLGGASGGSPSVVGPGTSFGSILPSVSSNYGLSF